MIKKLFFYASVILISSSVYSMKAIPVDNVAIAKECDQLAYEFESLATKENDIRCQTNLHSAADYVQHAGQYILKASYFLGSHYLTMARLSITAEKSAACQTKSSIETLRNAIDPIKDQIAGLD